MEIPTFDCIADESYCGVNEQFEAKPIDGQGHYKFKNLPGGMAVFIMKFNGIEVQMVYDLSEYKTVDIVKSLEQLH